MSDDRPRDERLYIPKDKLPDLLNGQTMPIYYQKDSKSANEELFPKFPASAAIEFCQRIKKSGQKSFTIYGKYAGTNPKAHKDILNWIIECCKDVDQGTKHLFRTVDDTEEPFKYYPQVMKSAEWLGILGFAGGLSKRLVAYARKNLMSVAEITSYLDMSLDMTEDENKIFSFTDVAVESVFQGWWDGEEKGRWSEYMDSEVGGLRDSYSHFDEALDRRIEKKKKERAAYLEKKRLEKLGLETSGDTGAVGAGWDATETIGDIHSGGVCEKEQASRDAIAATWEGGVDNASALANGVGGWSSDASTAAGAQSWAEEVQAEQENKVVSAW